MTRQSPTTQAAVLGGSMAAVLALATPLVMRWEGLSLDPYEDLAGIPTVCWGETHVPMRRYTRRECDALLAMSLEKHATPVLDCLPTTAPVPVKSAFVSFGYNVGTKAACSSTAAKRVREGRYADACHALMAWVYVKGKRVQGLANRRAQERDLCLTGVPA